METLMIVSWNVHRRALTGTRDRNLSGKRIESRLSTMFVSRNDCRNVFPDMNRRQSVSRLS